MPWEVSITEVSSYALSVCFRCGTGHTIRISTPMPPTPSGFSGSEASEATHGPTARSVGPDGDTAISPAAECEHEWRVADTVIPLNGKPVKVRLDFCNKGCGAMWWQGVVYLPAGTGKQP